jgi:hypothetical protein
MISSKARDTVTERANRITATLNIVIFTVMGLALLASVIGPLSTKTLAALGVISLLAWAFALAFGSFFRRG